MKVATRIPTKRELKEVSKRSPGVDRPQCCNAHPDEKGTERPVVSVHAIREVEKMTITYIQHIQAVRERWAPVKLSEDTFAELDAQLNVGWSWIEI